MQTLTFSNVQEMSVTAQELRSKGIAVRTRKEGNTFILEMKGSCQPLAPKQEFNPPKIGIAEIAKHAIQVDVNVFAFPKTKKTEAEQSAQVLRSKGKAVNLFLNRRGTSWILVIH